MMKAKTTTTPTRWAGLLVFVATMIVGMPAAVAQEYQKVADKDPTTIAANPFIAGAYGFIWVAILLYVAHIGRGLGRANQEIERLRRKLNA